MERRSFLLSLGAAAGLAPFGPAPAAGPTTLRAAARDAWLYGLALIEMAGSRSEALNNAPPNTLMRQRTLTTVETQRVTTPNNDTLYARAWLDLRQGPVRLTLPPSPGRYMSVALMDMYSNNFAILGTRTTGEDGGEFTIIGPDAANADSGAIRSPTPWVWLLARTLVDGEADLAAANAVQDRILVKGPTAPTPKPPARRTAPWAEYFASVHELMRENPPPATDRLWLARMAPLGVGTAAGFDASRFSAAEAAEIQAGAVEARMLLLSRRAGRLEQGWLYPRANLGDFGQDYLYRAQIAVGGLAALPNVEAMYMRAVTPEGRPTFDSAKRYRLRLPGDALPPAESFWSLTVYEATPDGQFFFTPNPLNRWALGDRSPGLVRTPDGGLEILMQREAPAGAMQANWLPTPSGRPFSAILRVYLPKEPLLDGSYRLPPLEAL